MLFLLFTLYFSELPYCPQNLKTCLFALHLKKDVIQKGVIFPHRRYCPYRGTRQNKNVDFNYVVLIDDVHTDTHHRNK